MPPMFLSTIEFTYCSEPTGDFKVLELSLIEDSFKKRLNFAEVSSRYGGEWLNFLGPLLSDLSPLTYLTSGFNDIWFLILVKIFIFFYSNSYALLNSSFPVGLFELKAIDISSDIANISSFKSISKLSIEILTLDFCP